MDPRVLMISPRRYEKAIWRSSQVEFEDLICGIDDVDLIYPTATSRGDGLFARQARRIAKLAGAELSFKPRISPIELSRSYELFAFHASQTTDLELLASVPDWRSRCAKAVCFIEEFWIDDIHQANQPARWLEQLASFDLIAVTFYNTVGPLSKAIDVPCAWVPSAVDTLLFFPGITPPVRSIDVYAMGRRSNDTHRVLLDHAVQHNWTYLFDTIDPIRVRDELTDHRRQLAELIKRTRYFFANKAKVDLPAHRGAQEEFGLRSFEGAAGGAVLIGHTPQTPALQQLFGWPDSHIHVPFGSTDLPELLAELERDPERVARIRRNNVVHSLRKHDWAHRWQFVLEQLGIEPRDRLAQRLHKLRATADAVEHEGWPFSAVERARSAVKIAG